MSKQSVKVAIITGANIHFDDLTCDQDGSVAYGQSKLACLLFSDELNRRLKAAGKLLTAISVHPGGSDSSLFNDLDEATRASMKAQVQQLLHSNEDAAKPSLFAALSDQVKGENYYGPTGPEEISGTTGVAIRNPICEDHDVAKRLWHLSEETTGQTFAI